MQTQIAKLNPPITDTNTASTFKKIAAGIGDTKNRQANTTVLIMARSFLEIKITYPALKRQMNSSAQCWMQFFKNVKERESCGHIIIQSYEHINMQAYNQTD